MAFFWVVVIFGKRTPFVVDCASKIALALGELVPIPTLPLESMRIRSELAVIMVIEPPVFVKYILLSDVEYSFKYAFALPETIASVEFVAA